MKSPLRDKLDALAAAATRNSGMVEYGPVAEEVRVSVMKPAKYSRLTRYKDMAGAIFTMNKASQGKIRELQRGDVSANASGLRELEVSVSCGLIACRLIFPVSRDPPGDVICTPCHERLYA